MRTEQVNLRLEEDLLADLEHVAEEEALDRGTVIRRLLRDSVQRWRIEQALREYQRGHLSMERAAEEAHVSLWELMDKLHRERIPHSMTADDVSESLRELGADMTRSGDDRPGFQTEVDWLGSSVVTLADVKPVERGILLVGVNPAPRSVAAGHYYQGQIGKRLWARLQRVGLLTEPVIPGAEDEAFGRAGNGLTDVVKRPTLSAAEVSIEELDAGTTLLRAKVRAWKPGLVLFAFKAAASAALGTAELRPGFGPDLEGVPTFLLTGPYAGATDAEQINTVLRDFVQQHLVAVGRPPKPPSSSRGRATGSRRESVRRKERTKAVGGTSAISMNEPHAVGDFIQQQLRQRDLPSVSAIEASEWLREIGVLGEETRPGRALRRLLRDDARTGQTIPGGRQDPPGPRGNWFIDRVDAPE